MPGPGIAPLLRRQPDDRCKRAAGADPGLAHDTRRLCGRCAEQDSLAAALEALTKGRLVTIDEGEGPEGVVEVSHEALIRGWPRLQGWVDADREALRIHNRLSGAAREWVRHDRETDYLYRGQ